MKRNLYPKVRSALIGTAALALSAFALSACTSENATSQPSGTCPTAPVNVVATTNVWGSIATQLAGPCVAVTTIITSPTADPHDFQPDSSTSSAYTNAKLVVENGLGYDAWSDKIVASLGNSAPPVLNLGTTVGLTVGDNPHIWYSPDYVQQSAKAITAAFKQALPSAGTQFDQAAAQFQADLGPYLGEVASIKAKFPGTNIGSTESIFVYMAQATDLNLTTPPGFMTAIANDSDPSAQDVQTFTTQLTNGTDKALMYNTQTDGGLPDQMKATAQAHNVPIVDITETLTPEGATFQAWQLAQLQNLSSVLSGASQ